MRLCHHSTRFILIGTQHNENVGAAARAIKTMGFNDLALVNPRDIKVRSRHKVIQMSSGAIDVLRNAKIFTTLDEAVADRNIICGTGMPNFDLCDRDIKEQGEGCMVGVQHKHAEPRVYFNELLQSRCHQLTPVGDIDGKEVEDAYETIRLALIFGSEQTGEYKPSFMQSNA